MYTLKQYGVTERFQTESTLYPAFHLARVLSQYRGKYKIATEQGETLAEISGKLRFQTEELAQYPAVGDFVMVSQETENSEAVIHHILTRKSIFLRKAVGITGQAQAVAVNIDTVFLCMSLDQNFSLSRMERYLSIAWDSGAIPVIVLTKTDLCEDLPSALQEMERISAFTDILALSMFDEDISERFAPYFSRNQTCAFIGSSGVGKSTLINRLLGKDLLETQELGKARKGQHTTTRRELYPCPLGGVVIDTPGMREMGAESTDLSRTFSDIETLATHCHFRNCTHTNEPGCAVLSAIAEGTLEQRRLDSFRKLQQETAYDGLSSREIETQKFERMFKEVGGMKNARKFAKEKNKHR